VRVGRLSHDGGEAAELGAPGEGVGTEATVALRLVKPGDIGTTNKDVSHDEE
jgi:hypothetical protein